MSNLLIPTGIAGHSRARLWFSCILLSALVLGVIAFYGSKFLTTQKLCNLVAAPNGGMEWLRQEFHLDDSQFNKIQTIHAAYAPHCDEMCRKIAETNSRLDRLLLESKSVTPELQAALKESSSLQEQCRERMLAHVYEVSMQMDPAEGARYLRLMKSQVIRSGPPSDTAVRAPTK
jgi:hypothetical protein